MALYWLSRDSFAVSGSVLNPLAPDWSQRARPVLTINAVPESVDSQRLQRCSKTVVVFGLA